MSNMPPDPDASDSREDGAPTKEACAKLYQEVGLLHDQVTISVGTAPGLVDS